MNGIESHNGILTLAGITPEMIAANLRPTKAPKGHYAKIIMDAVQSNEAYTIVKPYNEDGEQNALVTSLNNNLKTLAKSATKMGRKFPTCSVVKIDDNVVLVNVALHQAKIAEAAEAEKNTK